MGKKSNLLILLIVFLGALIYFTVALSVYFRRQNAGQETTKRAVSKPVFSKNLPTQTVVKKEDQTLVMEAVVEITDQGYLPVSTPVAAGGKVRFVNNGSKVMGPIGRGWGGLHLKPGQQMTKEFTTAGIYPYSDVIFPNLKGEVVVR